MLQPEVTHKYQIFYMMDILCSQIHNQMWKHETQVEPIGEDNKMKLEKKKH